MKAYYNERTRRLEFRDDSGMGRKIKFVILALPVLFLIIVALLLAVGVTPEPAKKAATIEINDTLHHGIDKRGNIVYENETHVCRIK
jgi:ABC-type lipoprotein release transport system permease subunit